MGTGNVVKAWGGKGVGWKRASEEGKGDISNAVNNFKKAVFQKQQQNTLLWLFAGCADIVT